MQLEDITLSDTVIISDPCYHRSIECHGVVKNVLPGTYHTSIKEEKVKGWFREFDERITEIQVLHKDYNETTWTRENFIVGVDSGQAGIFCDTIYPIGEDMGKYGDKGTWYGDCCFATSRGYDEQQSWYSKQRDVDFLSDILKEENISDTYKEHNQIRIDFLKEELKKPLPVWIQGGNVYAKGVVSSSGYGDGSYPCYTCINEEGKIIGIKIIFIGYEEEEEE